MQTRIVFAIALLTTLASRAAPPEQWVSIAKSAEILPTEIFLDLASISEKNNIRTAQTKAIILAPWPGNAQPEDRIAFGLEMMSFDCNAGLIKIGSTEVHYADGRRGYLDFKQVWVPVEDPTHKRMMDLVCASNPTGSS